MSIRRLSIFGLVLLATVSSASASVAHHVCWSKDKLYWVHVDVAGRSGRSQAAYGDLEQPSDGYGFHYEEDETAASWTVEEERSLPKKGAGTVYDYVGDGFTATITYLISSDRGGAGSKGNGELEFTDAEGQIRNDKLDCSFHEAERD